MSHEHEHDHEHCHEHEHHHHDHDHDHHHHHHEHGEHCDCGCEEENKGPITVTSMIQDSAVVVSAEYHVMASYEVLSPLISKKMEELAKNLNEMGCLIGHIKAAMDVHKVDMFSLTEDVVHHKEGVVEEMTVNFAIILFAIEETTAKEMVESMIEEIHHKVTNLKK
jgi:hypothetical protein